MSAKTKARILRWLVYVGATFSVFVLLLIVGYILVKGIPNLKPSLFAWEYNTQNVSLMPALINTLLMTMLSLAIAVPLGIGAAIYLTEYARRGNKLVKVVRITAETLSGIPSIIYGLFGSLFFVIAMGMGLSLLSGALTLSIMVLPLIMRTTEEALLAVPGILAGVILAIGRIVGETAALIYTAGTVAKVATSLFDSTRTLSVHMYAISSEGLYINQSYATAVVLLVIVIGINALSSFVAGKIGRRNHG